VLGVAVLAASHHDALRERDAVHLNKPEIIIDKIMITIIIITIIIIIIIIITMIIITSSSSSSSIVGYEVLGVAVLAASHDDALRERDAVHLTTSKIIIIIIIIITITIIDCRPRGAWRCSACSEPPQSPR
jgi:cytochrome b561